MLTSKQEIFVQKLIDGCSQREAYKFAFDAKHMKDSTIDSKSCLLFSRDDIRARHVELLEQHKERALWGRGIAELKLIWLLDKAQEDIEYKGLKQANSNAMINVIKELNTLTDLYPKKQKDDNNLEDKEIGKIADAILELRSKDGVK